MTQNGHSTAQLQEITIDLNNNNEENAEIVDLDNLVHRNNDGTRSNKQMLHLISEEEKKLLQKDTDSLSLPKGGKKDLKKYVDPPVSI